MYRAIKNFKSESKGKVLIGDEFKEVHDQWLKDGYVEEVKESKPASKRKTKELKSDKKTK